MMIQEIVDQELMLALIIRSGYSAEGIQFFTPDQFSQQLAYMHHPAGKKIDAHRHVPMARNVELTQEVLIVRKGRLRVDFYRDEHTYLESHILGAGDVILLAHGGHGFKVLEELEMIEVKQGPYCGPAEKTRFSPVPEEQVRIVS